MSDIYTSKEAQSDEGLVLHCANHPTVETTLRCNRCNKPICTKCAVLTPTGYRCKECVRGQQKAFETAEWYDYPLAFILAAGLAFAGSLLATVMSFFTIFLAPIAGGVIAEVVRLAVRRRRSKRLFQLAAAGVIIGSLPQLLRYLLIGLLSLNSGPGGLTNIYALLPLLWVGLYAFLATSTVYYRLGGIKM